MKKETVEKISVEEEETKAEEKEIETKKERAEESGPEGNLNDRRNETKGNDR